MGPLLQMVERHEADLVSRVGKAVKYHVICAFAPQLDRAGRRADDDAHALPVRVEGKRMQQLVDLRSKCSRAGSALRIGGEALLAPKSERTLRKGSANGLGLQCSAVRAARRRSGCMPLPCR